MNEKRHFKTLKEVDQPVTSLISLGFSRQSPPIRHAIKQIKAAFQEEGWKNPFAVLYRSIYGKELEKLLA